MLSSAEAERYGIVACSTELLGIQSCAKDVGFAYDGVIYGTRVRFLGLCNGEESGRFGTSALKAYGFKTHTIRRYWGSRRLTGRAILRIS